MIPYLDYAQGCRYWTYDDASDNCLLVQAIRGGGQLGALFVHQDAGPEVLVVYPEGGIGYQTEEA